MNQMQIEEIDLDFMGNPSFQLGDQNIKFIKDGLQVHQYGLKNMFNNQKVTQFSLDPANLKVNLQQYQLLKPIGKGASSEVFLGQYFANGQSMYVAVKVVNVMEKKLRDQILSDIKNFIGSSCPNLYMDLGSLRNIIALIYDGKIQVGEKIIANIARLILQGLKYIHQEKQMLHRDIKPENILLNSQGEVKIADFGISKRTNDGIASTFVGTLVYMSPERVKPPTMCSFKSDIWSVGLIIYELATGDNPYKLTTKSSVVDKILALLESNEPQLSQKIHSQQFRDFLSYCLCKDIDKRCSAKKLLTHQWITSNQDDTQLSQWVFGLKQKGLV